MKNHGWRWMDSTAEVKGFIFKGEDSRWDRVAEISL
jgi:hypothetical protein